MNAISIYRVTDPHRPPARPSATDRDDYNTLHRSLARSVTQNNGNFPLVLWHCWLGNRKGIRSVKSWMLVCWWWHSDWSFARSSSCHHSPAPSSLAPTKSRIYILVRLTLQVHLGKWPLCIERDIIIEMATGVIDFIDHSTFDSAKNKYSHQHQQSHVRSYEWCSLKLLKNSTLKVCRMSAGRTTK